MRVLWLCNFMLPAAAEYLHREATNKEGWISGLAAVVLEKQRENDITLAVAFPVTEELSGGREEIFHTVLSERGGKLHCYGFYEDSARPEQYDAGLEERMKKIIRAFSPDIVHCFGTEYPHTLAMCRAFPKKDRLLIGIQGLVAVYADAYFANLPEKTVRSVTFRDFVKKDSLIRQQQKFAARGVLEREAVSLAGNVTGRTWWDRHYTKEWNPHAVYYAMNETLRPEFYSGIWKEERCIPHSVFLSQGDYPIKGLHYMLAALPAVLEKYPDAAVYVAGSCPADCRGLKDRLKLSAYGKYLRRLIRQYHLENKIVFLGKLNAEEMKKQYLKSHTFVCCSSIENSPNSLGEAMLLGMPCISADVGGISSIFTGGEDGILYEGFREGNLEAVAERLSGAVISMWSDKEKRKEYCKKARKHAEKTHNGAENYRRMTEIYAEICVRV